MAVARRIAANQSVQGGYEGGTRHRFHSTLTPNFEPEFTESKPFGSKDTTTVDLSKEQGTVAIEGPTLQACELPFFLAGSIGNEVAVPDEDTGLTTFRYSSKSFEPVVNRKLEVAVGEPGRAETMTGGLVNELTITLNRDSGTNSIGGTILGKALSVDAPYVNTGVELLPASGFTVGNTLVQVGPNRPTLDTPLANPSDGLVKVEYTYNISGLFAADYQLDGAGASPAGFLPTLDRSSAVTLWIEANDAGVELVRSYRRSGLVYVTAQTPGPDGTKLTIITACKIVGKDTNGETGGKYGSNFTFRPVFDNVYGGSTLIEVIAPTLD